MVIIDDDRDIRESLSRVLPSEGHAAIEAVDDEDLGARTRDRHLFGKNASSR